MRPAVAVSHKMPLYWYAPGSTIASIWSRVLRFNLRERALMICISGLVWMPSTVAPETRSTSKPVCCAIAHSLPHPYCRAQRGQILAKCFSLKPPPFSQTCSPNTSGPISPWLDYGSWPKIQLEARALCLYSRVFARPSVWSRRG